MKRILVLVLLVVAACAQRTAAETIALAPTAARNAKTASVSLVTTLRINGSGRSLSQRSTATGVTDYAKRTSTMHLTVSGGPIALQPCQVLENGDLAYTTIAPKLWGPDGKHWTKVDVSKATGIDVSSLSSDPTAGIDYLEGVGGKITKVGNEDVRGTSTTHYRFTVGTQQLLTKLKQPLRDRVGAQFTQLGVTTIPIETWIDDKGLPRRVKTSFSGKQQAISLETTTVVELYDFGKPVNIQLPPTKFVREGADPSKAFTDCFGVAIPG